MKKIIATVAAGTLLLGMSLSVPAFAADPGAKSDTSAAPADSGKTEKKAHKGGKKAHKAAKKDDSSKDSGTSK